MIDICWNVTEKINYLQWSQNISHNRNDELAQPLQHTWPWKWHETSSLANSKFKMFHTKMLTKKKKTCCRKKQIRGENHTTRSKRKTFASVLGGGTEATNAARFCNWIILVWIISTVRCQNVATKGRTPIFLQLEVTKSGNKPEATKLLQDAKIAWNKATAKASYQILINAMQNVSLETWLNETMPYWDPAPQYGR